MTARTVKTDYRAYRNTLDSAIVVRTQEAEKEIARNFGAPAECSKRNTRDFSNGEFQKNRNRSFFPNRKRPTSSTFNVNV